MLFQKIRMIMKSVQVKEKLSDNPGNNILKLYNVLAQVESTTFERKLEFSVKNHNSAQNIEYSNK